MTIDPQKGLRIAALFSALSLTCSLASAQTPSYTQFDTGVTRPVISAGAPGAWDEHLQEKVWIIQESSNSYRLWYVGYSGGGQGTSKVGYATSTDGINWTKYTGNPIVSRSTQDQDVCVVKAPDGTYYMYLEVNDSWIDLLTSSDGIEFTPYAGNPVKTVAASPAVWREGSSWFMIYEQMSGAILNIHLATSPDGRTWTDSQANPIIAESSTTVPDSVVKDPSGTYHLYYHVSETGVWPAWHAVSTNLTTWTSRTRLYPALSSQSTFRFADGRIWSYFWNYTGDRQYYVRYGLQPTSPTVWHFDEGSGTVAADSSGNGAHALLTSGPAWVAGRQGAGLQFDGLNDYAEAGDWINLPNWTVSVWVKSPAAPSGAAASGPVHRDHNLQINWNHPNASYRGAAAVYVGGSAYAASFGTLRANTWYHLAATYDGHTLRAYRNGTLITSNTAPEGPADPDPLPLTFGRHAGANQYFAGTIDEVRIYDHALTQSEIAILAQPDPTPPSGLTLSAVPSGQAIALSWTAATDPDTGIASYRIFRGTTSGGSTSQIAEVNGTTRTYTDTATAPLTTYYYQVAAVNGGGLVGPLSNEASARTGNAPPAPPTGLTAQNGNTQVTLDWNNNTESDLAGYYVYRAASSGGPYSSITPSLLTASTYTDTGLTNNVTYYYIVTAVDAGGLESMASNIVSATPVDIDPTLAAYWPLDEGAGTTAMDVSANGYVGTLVNGPTWTTGRLGGALRFDGANDHVVTNFSEYLPNWTIAAWVWSPAAPASAEASGPIHKDHNFQINWNHFNPAYRGAVVLSVGGAWYAASLGSLAPNTWYHVVGTYDGETLRAFVNGTLVTANTDPSGPADFESEPMEIGAHPAAPQYFNGVVDDVRIYRRALSAAEVARLAVPDPTPPTTVTLGSNPSGQSVSLFWTAASDPESGVSAYRIYRGTVQNGSKTLIATVTGSTLTYLDTSTAPSTTYYYQVSAVNGGAVECAPSNEAAAVTGNDPPARPTGLTAVASNALVTLDWPNNSEADLAGYQVYRSTTSGGPYSPITPTLVAASTYTDAGLTNGTTYYYVVTAVDTASLESTASTQAQATPQNVDITLAALWAFDDATGTVARDSTSNEYNGTLMNGPTWTAGHIGGALSFDGVNDSVDTPFAEQLDTWTVAMWVRSPAAPAAAAASGPVNRDHNFQINWNHFNDLYRGAVTVSVGGAWYAASFGALAPNTWYYLVGTYDGETLNAYVNGVLVTSNTAPSGPPDAESLPVRLGGHAAAPQYFNGVIDDVRIYRRALSPAEVSALAAR